jgi:tetratricopeptide (TPR) repeat protein
MVQSPAPRKVYVPAVGPRLRKLLLVIGVFLAILGANSLYLAAVTGLEWFSQYRGTPAIYQNYFYHWMFLLHLALGLALVVPFLAFAGIHMWNARRRPNRRAVQMGYLVFFACLVLLGSGLVLLRLEGLIDVRDPTVRGVAYWAHVLSPLVAIWLYVLHRLAGPPIRWRAGLAYAGVVGLFVAGMVAMHSVDPRRFNVAGPPEGMKYFMPSLARTTTGNYIPKESLMLNDYCAECHQDSYEGWFHSVHHFSSFNNKPYLFSVRETRKVALQRTGEINASRFCAGCHDPVPFFSGAFNQKEFDDEKDPTAHAGITCTVCHGITHINGVRGNADYTIDEPVHYPFTFSQNAFLQFVNRQLIKAKPAFHKTTFLKPLHKTTEFCSVCHKVHLPKELTDYKEFLRGQNHYDSFLLSGVSGHGARSFYYPPKAQGNCNGCHMPLIPSKDPAREFGAKLYPGVEQPSVHHHLFLGANTGIAHLRGHQPTIEAHRKFLEGCLRIDLFGIKRGTEVDAPLTAPLRPEVPALEPGQTYTLEAVIRTLRLGHHFTQGTVDSNEVWVELIAKSGDRILGHTGHVDSEGRVDRWAHFLNVYMLDRHGHRIDRRNAQDIFTPLYDHQIPPGAAQVGHYVLTVPEGHTEPITVEARVQYRKFDLAYLRYVFGPSYINDLPIVTLASDQMVFPVAGGTKPVGEQKSPVATWERWNDYGIGLFLETPLAGGHGSYRQAADAFREVEKLGRFDGPLNLARVHFREGQLDLAAAALRRSQQAAPPAPRWVVAWLAGLVQRQQGDFAAAVTSLHSVLEDQYDELRQRGFDFSKDYIVRNELGQTYYDWSRREAARGTPQRRRELLREAEKTFLKTLQVDPENLAAHHGLWYVYDELGDTKRRDEHGRLRDIYRPDENAQGVAVATARRLDPAANHAAEAVVLYSLHGPPKESTPAPAAGQ